MKFKFLKTALVSLMLIVSCFTNVAQAGLIFDNGTTIDPANTTWNMTNSQNFTIFDDFTLSNGSTITNIDYSIFAASAASYQQSFISILEGFGGNIVTALFSTVGDVSANGLTSNNSNVPTGLDIALSGLNINLSAGNYVIGISTACQICSVANGDSGFGSSLFQNDSQRSGDHMAFKLSNTTDVPEPSTLAIFALGMMGLASRRFKKQS